ncbi:MAG: phage terminase large subunit, partial [Candidatus Gracilibacteria bacterium]
DRNTKIIFVGNLLHEDSVLMRLKQGIQDNKIDGVFREYPLVNENGVIAWLGKFPTMKEIQEEKRKILSENAWQREYMLRILPDVDQIIHPEWIQFYDELPSNCHTTCCGVDLAISKKDTADFTAIVSAKICGHGGEEKIYILPYIVNKRMHFRETVDALKSLPKIVNEGKFVKLYIEKVCYQDSLVQQLMHEGVRADGVDIHGEDKTARLNRVSARIFNGQILFPRQGAEKLIEQLVHFGVERHDDLVDAFTLLIIQIMNKQNSEPRITIISTPFRTDRRRVY